MSSRAPEKAIVMRCSGKALVPTDAFGEEAMAKINGKEVLVWTKRARNPRHHRKAMAMIHLIFKNQSKFGTVDQLLTYLKLRTGHFDSYIVDGKPVVVARSIAFDALGQDEFESLYDRLLDVVVTEIVPGLKRSDIKRELLGFTERSNSAPPHEERAHD